MIPRHGLRRGFTWRRSSGRAIGDGWTRQRIEREPAYGQLSLHRKRPVWITVAYVDVRVALDCSDALRAAGMRYEWRVLLASSIRDCPVVASGHSQTKRGGFGLAQSIALEHAL